MAVAVRLALVFLVGLALAACRGETQSTSPIRPVRTVTAHLTLDADPITMTGQIQSRDQANLAFRIGGRMVERSVSVGDSVAPGQTIARLDTADAENALTGARANLAAVEATLTQAQADEKRQNELLQQGVIANARYEKAAQALQSAQAQVDAATAQAQSAEDSLGYAELKSDTSGVVTATGAEPGEVVQAGRMIVQVAREGGKDAVFNVPARLIRGAPAHPPPVSVALPDDPSITATGTVREVAPQADATTGTYLVKVGLIDPPPSMRLGATIVGTISLSSQSVVRLPGAAMTEVDGKPAVWVVDPAGTTVALRPVSVLRYNSDAVIITDGLADGETVVAAGVHALQPGQEVRLLNDNS